MATQDPPEWRDPKLNVMGKLFDYQLWLMIKKAGWPASPYVSIKRMDGQFNEDDYLHLDVGGEGYHEADGIVSGFNSAINVNAQEHDSQPPKGNIPHLVKLEGWSTAYPFESHFSDYMTLQGAPLTDRNVSEFTRCARPGGEIGLWIDQNYYRAAINQLAENLGSFPEWEVWDEFNGRFSLQKTRITVPGQDYMIGFSMANNWFFIQGVSGSGKLLKETDRGGWKFDYNALTTFKIRGKTYVFAWSDGNKYYFIQELLPNGKLGRETATGSFKFDYQVMKTAEMNGRTYLIGHSYSYKYLFIQELLEGGQLGAETYTETNANYDQAIPFSRDGKTYMFTFESNSKNWTIRELQANGFTQTNSGRWNNAYIHVIVNVKGKPVLFGQNQSTNYWFLQLIEQGGKMGSETANGHWSLSYATLSTYTHGKRAFIFGQNSKGTRNWFIQEVLPGGKMGEETDHENWKFAYENVEFYTQYQ